MKKVLTIASLLSLLVGCFALPETLINSTPSPTDRFDINSYTVNTTDTTNLNGLWVLVSNDYTSSQTIPIPYGSDLANAVGIMQQDMTSDMLQIIPISDNGSSINLFINTQSTYQSINLTLDSNGGQFEYSGSGFTIVLTDNTHMNGSFVSATSGPFPDSTTNASFTFSMIKLDADSINGSVNVTGAAMEYGIDAFFNIEANVSIFFEDFATGETNNLYNDSTAKFISMQDLNSSYSLNYSELADSGDITVYDDGENSSTISFQSGLIFSETAGVNYFTQTENLNVIATDASLDLFTMIIDATDDATIVNYTINTHVNW